MVGAAAERPAEAAGLTTRPAQLAGHENSQTTMDFYAKVKCDELWELAAVMNDALRPTSERVKSVDILKNDNII